MAEKGIGGALSLSPDGKLVVFGANDGCVYAVKKTKGPPDSRDTNAFRTESRITSPQTRLRIGHRTAGIVEDRFFI